MKQIFTTLILFSSLYANQPVMLESEEGIDPCALSKVQGLDKRGDGFLAVRSAAGSSHPMIDKLYNDQKVWSCDVDGKWIGIVYGGEECVYPTSNSRKQPYKGKCKTGWVYNKWLLVIAG
ncbi:MAG: hypothetical protein U9O24_09455 [Campylobacterota bacterium]|nr:hypothetical protein [Campylobacterota bacterium]